MVLYVFTSTYLYDFLLCWSPIFWISCISHNPINFQCSYSDLVYLFHVATYQSFSFRIVCLQLYGGLLDEPRLTGREGNRILMDFVSIHYIYLSLPYLLFSSLTSCDLGGALVGRNCGQHGLALSLQTPYSYISQWFDNVGL